MTTAHRPTFNPARGGTARGEGDLSKLSEQYSSKDMPSHLKLKYRQSGQGNEEDIRKRDLRRELEDQERDAVRERKARDSASGSKKPRLDDVSAGATVDADDPNCKVDSSSDDSDSDEDDTAALMAELDRIKKERAAEKAQKEEQEQEKQEQIRLDNILHANPLLTLGTPGSNDANGEFKVKRRWDDDVVFRNCAKGLDERKKEPNFINDAIRSEFHKKFMDKYIK